MVDASDESAGDVDAGVRLGVLLPNQPPIPVDQTAAADAAAAALLIVLEAADAAASPIDPGANVSRTAALDDPGLMPTATSVALGYCASIAD